MNAFTRFNVHIDIQPGLLNRTWSLYASQKQMNLVHLISFLWVCINREGIATQGEGQSVGVEIEQTKNG